MKIFSALTVFLIFNCILISSCSKENDIINELFTGKTISSHKTFSDGVNETIVFKPEGYYFRTTYKQDSSQMPQKVYSERSTSNAAAQEAGLHAETGTYKKNGYVITNS